VEPKPCLQRKNRQTSARALSDPDLLSCYLKEITAHQLLSRKDEYDLGERLVQIRKEIEKLGHRLSEGSITDLEYASRFSALDRLGRDHRNRFVTSNLRLVISVAKRYRHKGLTLSDLINEGNVGLIHAAERFDYSRGCKFSTYATWWVRQAIEKAIADSGRTIRIPAHVVGHIRKIEQESVRYFAEHGIEPTSQAISEVVHVPTVKIDLYRRFTSDVGSLDVPIEDDSAVSVLELQAAGDYAEPFDWAYQSSVKATFQSAFTALDKREREIVSLRYGIGGTGPLTLEEIGNRAGITRERVRQVLNAALSKLRHDPTVRELDLRL
jgi:RNA polymerase primary sigma factor